MIALVGDRSESVVAHRAIPIALSLVRKAANVEIEWEWIGTETIDAAEAVLGRFSGVWCVPASPYRSMDGALRAIRFARETGRPFLGTCGGFQHAVIEFARNVANIAAAEHAETSPQADTLVVTPLACSLAGVSDDVQFTPGSQLHKIFAGQPSRAEYQCNFGVNPAFRDALEQAGLRFTGFDQNDDIRALELPSHPFFCATLFQPERSAFRGEVHPLIEAFARSAEARIHADAQARPFG